MTCSCSPAPGLDSQSLLCIVLAGDARRLEKLCREELIPLSSRIGIFVAMAGELRMSAAQREITTLAEKRYLRV